MKNRICTQTNPENCKYLNSPLCAFVRKDRKCTKSKKESNNGLKQCKMNLKT